MILKSLQNVDNVGRTILGTDYNIKVLILTILIVWSCWLIININFIILGKGLFIFKTNAKIA